MDIIEKLLSSGLSQESAEEFSEMIKAKKMSDGAIEELLKAFSGSDSSSEDDPLQALSKAISNDSGEGEEDGEDDYNEEYMKKYMKRYMKSNKAACSNMMKELVGKNSEMKKAIDELDFSQDVDDNSDVFEVTDMTNLLNQQSEFNSQMLKAIEDLNSNYELISNQEKESYELLHKASKVIVQQGEIIKTFASEPQGRKGVIGIQPVKENLTKAINGDITFTPEDNKKAYQAMFKAVKVDKDPIAGEIIGCFESANHDANKLRSDQKQYIANMLSKEAQ